MAGKKSIEEMETIEFQQRSEVPKSHFGRTTVASPTTSSSTKSTTNEQTNSVEVVTTNIVNATNPIRPQNAGPASASSRFQEHFSKLTESHKFSEIQKDLASMPPEIPPEFKEVPPAKPQPANSNSLLVNPRQRGNPLLKSINNVPFEYADIIPDYVMGRTTCALFLSLRYHNLNPNYIQDRLKQLGSLFLLRILLVQVDTKDPQHSLRELTKISMLANCTLLLAWSPEEAGRYIESYKILENKPPDILMKRQDADLCSKLIDALTSVKSINRNDAIVLLTEFGSIENILKASEDELSDCSGVGPLKARKLRAVLHESFVKNPVKR